MKILISNDGPSAFYYIRHGLANAFTACGHEAIVWDINKKPPNDAFDEFEPDLFLGQVYNATPQLCDAIRERPHLKVIMKAGDWGKLSNKIPDSYGVLKADQYTTKLILDLYNETRKPDYVHIYYHQDYIDDTHGFWRREGIPLHSHMLAADVFNYTNGQKMDVFKSDITFVGGYWEYKAKNINKYLLSLCDNYRYRIKIFGNSHWPVAQYCGSLPTEVVRHALASAIICPQIHEPHSTEYGFDMSERTFKLLSNKCFCISDYVEGLNKLFGEDLVMAKTPQDFQDKIDHFLRNPDDRNHFITNGYNKVMNEHTYFHRVRDMFINLGFESHARRVMDTYNNIRRKIENEENNIV